MENRMKSIAQRLEEHASPTPSKWRELFDFLETNRYFDVVYRAVGQ